MLYELVMVPQSGPAPVTGRPSANHYSNLAMQKALTGVPISKLPASNFLTPAPAVPAATPAVTPLSSAAAVEGSNNNGSLTTDECTADQSDLFVGDLSPDLENHQLKEAFSAYGTVTECKIIKDMHTQKPKGYGFVAFASRDEAQEALRCMQGRVLGSRPIRINWAVRKPSQTPADPRPLDYDEVAQASSVSNCTVYVGGIVNGLCEELIRDAFKEFGVIHEVRIFKEKGYAFIRFDNHEAAARAIVQRHGREVGGQACKCSWGKECNGGGSGSGGKEPTLSTAAASVRTSQGLYGGYYVNASAASAAAAAAAAAASATLHYPSTAGYPTAAVFPPPPHPQLLAAYQQPPPAVRPHGLALPQSAISFSGGLGGYLPTVAAGPAAATALSAGSPAGGSAAIFAASSSFCQFPILPQQPTQAPPLPPLQQQLPTQLLTCSVPVGRHQALQNRQQQQQQQQHQQHQQHPFVPNPNAVSFQPAN